MFDDVDLLVCGAGPVGCVVAERCANVLGWNVLVIDQRSHIAGNCHDSWHTSGIRIHNYGPHYFRTNNDSLLQYLSRFTDWLPARYEVRSLVRGNLFPFPINLDTLEQFFGRNLDSVNAARLLEQLRVSINSPKNAEEYVLDKVGRELYEAFYLNYTLKQWGVHPKDLDASVCGRIPVRLNRDPRYVEHRHQVMPKQGFTALFQRMLRNRKIRVVLDCPFEQIRNWVRPREATVYSGPVDSYFQYCFGKLPYRSLQFEFVTHEEEFVQPCVQINYPNDFAYTRSVEIKHVTGQKHSHTVLSYETPSATGEAYYPIPCGDSARLYQRYQQLARRETANHKVFFCGRLAQYRYFNTDEVIQEALQCFQQLSQLGGKRSSASSARPNPALLVK